jgi:hypothetical protein
MKRGRGYIHNAGRKQRPLSRSWFFPTCQSERVPMQIATSTVPDQIASQLVLQLVCRTCSSALHFPPFLDTRLHFREYVCFVIANKGATGNTHLMEFTPTYQPRHLIARFEFLKANHALGFVALFINTVFLSRYVRHHSARHHAHPVTRTLAVACSIAHTAGSLAGQTG